MQVCSSILPCLDLGVAGAGIGGKKKLASREEKGPPFGLHVNINKCEFFVSG